MSWRPGMLAVSSACVFAVSPAVAAPIRIELLPSVALSQQQVVLGDIAHLATDDLPMLQQLMKLPLGQVQRDGGSATIGRDHLMRWIRARTGIADSDIEWSGTVSSTVYLALQKISGEAVAGRARESVRELLRNKGLRGEIFLYRMPKDVQVPAGDLQLEARPTSANALLARRLVVWVEVRVDGNMIRVVPVDLTLSAFGPALVAVRNLAQGDLLEEADFTTREMEWSGRTARPEDTGIFSLSPAHGDIRLRKPLTAGEAMMHGQTEPAPMVVRGGWATLRTIRGQVELESRVEVLQDGVSGQTIKVRLPNTPGAILARVAGRGIVRVP